MSPRFEALLARIYVDPVARALTVTDPQRLARDAGLDARETAALVGIDRTGLALASESFARKRAHGAGAVRPPRWPRLLGVVRAVIRRARIPAKSGSKHPAEGQGGRHGRQE